MAHAFRFVRWTFTVLSNKDIFNIPFLFWVWVGTGSGSGQGSLSWSVSPWDLWSFLCPLGFTFQRVCKVTKACVWQKLHWPCWLWFPCPGSFLWDYCCTKQLWNWTPFPGCNLSWTLADILYLSHTCTKHTNVAQMLHKYQLYNLTTLSETQPLYSPTYRATESILNTNTQQTPNKHIRIYRKMVVAGWHVTVCPFPFLLYMLLLRRDTYIDWHIGRVRPQMPCKAPV